MLETSVSSATNILTVYFRPRIDVVASKILNHEERDAFTIIGNDLSLVVRKNLLKCKLSNLIACTMTGNISRYRIYFGFCVWTAANISDHLNVFYLSTSEWCKYLTTKSADGFRHVSW